MSGDINSLPSVTWNLCLERVDILNKLCHILYKLHATPPRWKVLDFFMNQMGESMWNVSFLSNPLPVLTHLWPNSVNILGIYTVSITRFGYCVKAVM